MNDTLIMTNNYQQEIESKKSLSQLELPKPDSENITVLTHNLPNHPILPWNHYDSPWEHPNESQETKVVSTESVITETSSEDELNK